MKKIILLFSSIIILFSCQDIYEETGSVEEKSDEKQLAMETRTDYTSIQVTELIRPNQHAAFISGEVSDRISSSAMYTSAPPSDGAVTDTIHDPTLLPIVMEYSMEEQIYSDGSVEKRVNDFYVVEYCSIFSLYSYPFDFSKLIARTVYKDGMSYSYNNEGELIHSRICPMPDMTDVLDGIEDEYGDQAETRNSGLSGIEIARNMLAKNVVEGVTFKVEELANGRISIETTSNESVTTRLGTSYGFTRSKTILTADLQYTVMSEEYEGEQLVSRRSYYYSLDNKKMESRYSLSDGTTETKINPSYVVSQRLVVDKGTPMIQTTQKRYTRNQVTYNNVKNK